MGTDQSQQNVRAQALWKKLPNKCLLGCVVCLQLVAIIVGVTVIFTFYNQDQFKEEAGSASLSIQTQLLTVKGLMSYVEYSTTTDLPKHEYHSLHLKMGVDSPSGSPINCWRIQDGTDTLCLDWKNYAKLQITYSKPDQELDCYEIQWQDINHGLTDCFDISSSDWYTALQLEIQPDHFNDLTFNRSIPISGSTLEEACLWTISDEGSYCQPVQNMFGGVTKLLWVNSHGFLVNIGSDYPIKLEQTARGEMCIIHNAMQLDYENFPLHRNELTYQICSSTNPMNVVSYFYRLHAETLPASSDAELQGTIMWGYSLNDIDALLDGMVGLARNISAAYGEERAQGYGMIVLQSNVEMIEFQHVELVSSAIQLTKNLGFVVVAPISPYFTISYPSFIEGVDRKYWIRDYTGGVPALNIYEQSVIVSVDATSAVAWEWYSNLLADIKSNYSFDVFHFQGGYADSLPRYYTLDIQINSPAQYSHVLVKREASLVHQLNTKPLIVSAAQNNEQLSPILSMPGLRFDWSAEGLRGLIPQALALSLASYKLFIPSPVGTSIRQSSLGVIERRELYIRWLQAVIFMPYVMIEVDPWDKSIQDSEGDLHEGDISGQDVIDIVIEMLKFREDYALVQLESVLNMAVYHKPIISPVWWNYPLDPRVYHETKDAFMMGDILVAPVMTSGARNRTIYLPSGAAWKLYRSGKKTNIIYSGGSTVVIQTGLHDLLHFFACDICLPNV